MVLCGKPEDQDPVGSRGFTEKESLDKAIRQKGSEILGGGFGE